MKKILVLCAVIIAAIEGQAQQVALNSQYMFNDFTLNPAVAGTKSYSPVSFTFRRQWMGMDEAPITQNLIAHTTFGKNGGVGLHLYNDAAGPSRRTGLSAAYSYQIRISGTSKLSFGLSAALTQYILDRDKLRTEIPNDIAVTNYGSNQLVPDFNFGMYWYGEQFFLGVSAFNLIESKNDLYDVTTEVTSTLDRVFYLNGGYSFKLGDDFSIDPSLLVRYMTNAPFQLDGNLRFVYKQKYWLGASYRMQDAIAVMVGADMGKLTFGYSYDITTSNRANYNSGTHEIFVGLQLENKNGHKVDWHKRNRIYSSFPG